MNFPVKGALIRGSSLRTWAFNGENMVAFSEGQHKEGRIRFMNAGLGNYLETNLGHYQISMMEFICESS